MNAAPDISAPKISWQRCLLLFLAVVALALPQAAMLPLIDRDEPRFAEAAREMIQSGNYVVPTFNGAPRYDKPPLIYWCQAAAYRIFGENALAARLPSLIATAATAVLLYTWGTRLGSGFIGVGAGLFYALCLQTIQQGRVATADALLIFFMTLTAFAGWMLIRPGQLRVTPLPCHLVIAIGIAGGFLAKGPEALLPVIPLFWFGRGARLGILLSLIAGLALMLLWGIPAYVETHGDYLWQSWKAGIADRAWGSDQGHGASSIGMYVLELPYYLLLFWVSTLPWSPLVLLQFRKLYAGWQMDFTDRYLLLNAALLFLVFTLMATKLPHYTLPAFPPLALVVLRRWKAAGLSPAVPLRLAGGIGLLFTLLTVAFVPTALERGYNPSPTAELVREAGIDLKPNTQFALVDFKEPTTVWEMRSVTTFYGQFIAGNNYVSFLNQPGPRAVLISTDVLNHLTIRVEPSVDWKYFTARGLNAAKGKPIDLTLVVKP